MEKIIVKPRFEEVVTIKTMNLPDVGLKFSTQRVGPMDFVGLRQVDYGPDFRIPTMSELVPLVYASLENKKKYKLTKIVLKILRNHWLTGNTTPHYFPVGLFVEDNPAIKDGRIVTPRQKELENRLGSHKEKKVVFSKDKSVRFAPKGSYELGKHTPESLANDGFVIAGHSSRGAEELGEVSLKIMCKPET